MTEEVKERKEKTMLSQIDYHVGEYIIYVNGDTYQLGRIKSLRPDGAFVAYHEGETGSKTTFDRMHKLQNEYTIADTTLGGSYFKEVTQK